MKKLITLLLICLGMVSTLTNFSLAVEASINWTKDEIAFINEHRIISLGVDPQFVPFEFIDKDGKYKGITADYLSIISERTGIQFDILKNVTWPEAYDLAISGDLGVLPAIAKTEDREKHFLFSDPYYYYKRVIVTRDTDAGIAGIDDLEKLTVAVQRNSSHHSYLLSYPKINLSIYDSVDAALTAVANGTERAFVGNLATTNYLIRSNGLTHLKFIAFEAEEQQALYFAVRKDWPEMVSIINKVLGSITEEEKIAINNKWIDLESETNYGPLIRIITIGGAFVAVILAVSVYWINRLRKEVKKRVLIQADLVKAKQEAEEANDFKSSFMARMSHEIRTPLNAITGMAYLLKKTEITLTQSLYVDRMTQASNSMLRIINDILDFSKIEAGKVELEIASFSMDQVIQNVVNIISYKIEEQRIGFKLAKDPLVPNWFYGDAKRIEQVLINILNNAAKFTSTGEVSLDIRLVAKESEKYHLSFLVKDTGIGMKDEQIKNLFLPFTQGDSSINRRFGGSGLGLSIVKYLVDMMGGNIKVYSTLAEGSTFIVNLSFEIDRQKENEYINALSDKHFNSVRTLVLEKTGSSMNLLESYLSAFGMQCELTTSSASALSMLEVADGKFAKPFDLVIIDYDTPTEGGFKFIESIRNNRKLIKTPKSIMLLPMAREDLFDKINEYGVDLGIGKPIIPSVLLNGILDIFSLKAVSASQPISNIKLSPQKLKPYIVLLVEDNKTNQFIAKSLLQQAGIESIMAADGKEAIDLYCQYNESIDLILMDLHMPVINGYEASNEIRKISPSVPIVAMTADVILGVREKCEQYGIRYYISKPFDPDRFIQTIMKILIENNPAQEDSILNRSVGQKNLGGNLEIYQQVLAEYHKENQDTHDILSLAISEKRYSDALQIVHKVKSSSGSIGASLVYDLSIKLQKALNSGDDREISILHCRFSKLLINLLQEIAEYQDNN